MSRSKHQYFIGYDTGFVWAKSYFDLPGFKRDRKSHFHGGGSMTLHQAKIAKRQMAQREAKIYKLVEVR